MNALDAVIQTFTAVSMLRQQVRPEARIHGIVTHGGAAANIIPEFAAALFYVRAPKLDEMWALHKRVIACAGDLGGVVAQDLSLRFEGVVERLVLFNTIPPVLPDAPPELPRVARMAADYFIRQGTDPDGLAAELATPDERRRYIATFYTSRFWAHPGAFTPDAVRAGWGRVQELQSAMDEGRQRHLVRLGFTATEAEDLSALHTRNFM